MDVFMLFFGGMCIIDFINNTILKIKQGTKLKLSPLIYIKNNL